MTTDPLELARRWLAQNDVERMRCASSPGDWMRNFETYPSIDDCRTLARALLSVAAERDELRRSCPCTLTTPCHERCTCVSPVSSSGCRRCCTYGSLEQRTAKAESLAALSSQRDRLRAALKSTRKALDSGPTSVDAQLAEWISAEQHRGPFPPWREHPVGRARVGLLKVVNELRALAERDE